MSGAANKLATGWKLIHSLKLRMQLVHHITRTSRNCIILLFHNIHPRNCLAKRLQLPTRSRWHVAKLSVSYTLSPQTLPQALQHKVLPPISPLSIFYYLFFSYLCAVQTHDVKGRHTGLCEAATASSKMKKKLFLAYSLYSLTDQKQIDALQT